MNWQAPNLARDPFVNQRPLVRTTTALSVAAVLLTGWNVASYLRAGSGAARLESELRRVVTETDEARARLATIDRDLASRDLAAENRKAAFLNERIEERTFSWNRLFTRLAEAEPRGVRIRSLSYRFGQKAESPESSSAESSSELARAPVALAIQGEAEDGESLLEFVDRLFAHPAFDTPKLAREGRQGGGVIAYNLTVIYLPDAKDDAAFAKEAVPPPSAGSGGAGLEEPNAEGAEPPVEEPEG